MTSGALWNDKGAYEWLLLQWRMTIKEKKKGKKQKKEKNWNK